MFLELSSLILLAVSIGLLFRYFQVKKELKEIRKKSILDDLELATSDQIIGELRKRNKVPYLFLRPLDNQDQHGISIEVHGVEPIQSLLILHIATTIITNEFKSRGLEIPDFSAEGLSDGFLFFDE